MGSPSCLEQCCKAALLQQGCQIGTKVANGWQMGANGGTKVANGVPLGALGLSLGASRGLLGEGLGEPLKWKMVNYSNSFLV